MELDVVFVAAEMDESLATVFEIFEVFES